MKNRVAVLVLFFGVLLTAVAALLRFVFLAPHFIEDVATKASMGVDSLAGCIVYLDRRAQLEDFTSAGIRRRIAEGISSGLLPRRYGRLIQPVDVFEEHDMITRTRISDYTSSHALEILATSPTIEMIEIGRRDDAHAYLENRGLLDSQLNQVIIKGGRRDLRLHSPGGDRKLGTQDDAVLYVNLDGSYYGEKPGHVWRTYDQIADTLKRGQVNN